MKDNTEYLNSLNQELMEYQKKLSAIKDSLKKKTGKDMEQVYSSLQGIFQKAGEAYDQLKDASAEEWEPLKEIANNALADLKTSFEEFKKSTSEQTKEYINQVEGYTHETLECSAEYIKSNPFKSILLAGGLGFIMGRVLK